MDTLRTYSMFAFIVLGAGTLQVFWFLRALLCFGFEEKKKWKNGFGESEVIEQSAVSWTTTIQMHTASLCFIAVTRSTIVRFVFFSSCVCSSNMRFLFQWNVNELKLFQESISIFVYEFVGWNKKICWKISIQRVLPFSTLILQIFEFIYPFRLVRTICMNP